MLRASEMTHGMLTVDSNYDCTASEADDSPSTPYGEKRSLVIPDGANNLASIDWGTRIRSLRCKNFKQ